MPKNKKKQASSSSDSDEGPLDRDPPAKKVKTSSNTDDKEPSWVLQGKKIAKVRSFKGKAYVDIREYYEKNGELLPGKKGVSLTPEQWRKLVSISEEITDSITKMC